MNAKLFKDEERLRAGCPSHCGAGILPGAFAALHIPDFPVVAALRARPGKDSPCAVLALTGGQDPEAKLPLLAVNPAARRTGIDRGWALNRALVRCPDLEIIARDPSAEAALRAELIGLGESLTPDLEIASEDSVLLDLSLRRRPVEWTRLVLENAGLWHARAGTPDLAYLAAKHPLTRGRAISAADLVLLPLDVLASLAPGHAGLKLLDLWGLKSLGDFMKLPRQALVERLGPEPGRWYDLLHGKTCRLLRLHRPPESFSQSFDFEDAVTALDPLIFALKRLLHTLAGRLAVRHLAASSLELELVLESGPPIARRIRLPEPQTAVEGMLSPLQTMLGSLQLEAAVEVLKLDVETTFATAAQREWFGRQLPQPERWAETLAQLEALLGPGRVGIPVPPDSHAPDRFSLHPAAGAVVVVPEQMAFPDCPLPLHRFRPPYEIAVAFESRGRRPWPLALLNGPYPGEIIDRRGPFPVSGEWWEPANAWQRMEWDVQVASRQLLRLVFETPDSWKVDGIYG
jgi:protein ImuB